MRLQDKVIAITGSGSGLGRECALLFAAEGANVVTSDVVTGRAQAVAKEVEAAGGHAVGIDADVRSEADIERLVRTAVDSFGRIDVMFADAGIPEPGFGAGRLEDLTLDDWNNILATNALCASSWRSTTLRGRCGPRRRRHAPRTTSAAAFNAYTGFPPTPRARPEGTASSGPRHSSGGSTESACQRPMPDARHVDQLRHAARGRRPRQVVRGDGALGPGSGPMPLKLDRPPTLVTTPIWRCSWRPTSRPTCRASASRQPTVDVRPHVDRPARRPGR